MSAGASSSNGAAAASSSGSKRSFTGAAADTDAERRVQPRHFHAGPNPTAAAAAASGSGHAATQGLAPATRLYRHALESIFAFLGRNDLVKALQVSRSWLAAVKSMGCMKWWHPDPSPWPLCVLVQSAMARHFTALGHFVTRVQLNADRLWILARGMAHLNRLTCGLSLSPSPPSPLPLYFTPALTKLDLELQAPITAAQANAAITNVRKLTLLESFTIKLPADAQVSFAPLASLPQLRRLVIHWPNGGAFSDTQVDELRSMPNLHLLRTEPMSKSLLGPLLRRPHALQWQIILFLPNVDDEAAECLARLPSLIQLHVWIECTRFDWLQHLPKLSDVDIGQEHGSDQLTAIGIQSLLAGLQHCTQIQKLTLHNFRRLSAAHLTDLLPRLPQLDALTLEQLEIDSLSFLSQQPVQRLTQLALTGCKKLPLVELRHVHALGGVKSLRLWKSMAAPMDELSQSLHTPPSVLMPQLEEFAYAQP